MASEAITPDTPISTTPAPSPTAQERIAAARETIAAKSGPLIDQAKGFAKARPFATAALAGVLGVAFLNTLRGRS